jgi:hypothetical protein
MSQTPIPKTPKLPKDASGALKATIDKMPMAKQHGRGRPTTHNLQYLYSAVKKYGLWLIA